MLIFAIDTLKNILFPYDKVVSEISDRYSLNHVESQYYHKFITLG